MANPYGYSVFSCYGVKIMKQSILNEGEVKSVFLSGKSVRSVLSDN